MAGQKARRDWAYMAISSIQLVGMLVLDLVAFYPKPLYQPPSSPLHFLLSLRATYSSSTGDPFFALDPTSHGATPPWMHAFLAVEGLVQLPLIVYLVRQLARPSQPTSGAAELVGLALGCLNFMGAVACCGELLAMGPEVLAGDKKASLLYGTYMPFAVIPAIMAVDMFGRVLARVQTAEAKAKAKKRQ